MTDAAARHAQKFIQTLSRNAPQTIASKIINLRSFFNWAIDHYDLAIKNPFFNRFRHSFASNLIRAGRSIKAVQELLRHENVQLTLNTYSHLLKSDLAEAVEL